MSPSPIAPADIRVAPNPDARITINLGVQGELAGKLSALSQIDLTGRHEADTSGPQHLKQLDSFVTAIVTGRPYTSPITTAAAALELTAANGLVSWLRDEGAGPTLAALCVQLSVQQETTK